MMNHSFKNIYFFHTSAAKCLSVFMDAEQKDKPEGQEQTVVAKSLVPA